MVSEEIFDALTRQLVAADKLIDEQEDNLDLLDEIGADSTEERAQLTRAIEKRNLVFDALSKRTSNPNNKNNEKKPAR